MLNKTEELTLHRQAPPRLAIRYLELPPDIVAKSLMVDATDYKKKAVEKLGIIVPDGETPLHAWIKAMCRENGLPEQIPAPKVITETLNGMAGSGAKRFIFFIA